MEVALILSSFSFQKFIEAFECGLLLLSPLVAFSLFPVASHPPPFIIGVFPPRLYLAYLPQNADRQKERARARQNDLLISSPDLGQSFGFCFVGKRPGRY